MKKIINEGNQIHSSGSDFLTSSGSGSGSTSQKVKVPTVPVPVPQRWKEQLGILGGKATGRDTWGGGGDP